MTESRPRTIFLSALLTSLSFGVLPVVAQDPAEDWALKIVDRRIDGSTGQPHFTLRNGSDLEVTAYGVRSTLRGPGGRGSTTVGERSFLSGEGYGIGPGESLEVPAGSWPVEDPGPAWKHTVELAYEVLSDNSAHGDEGLVEREFARRLAGWAELDAALACLRKHAAQVALESEFRDLLREVRTCGESALGELEGQLSDEDARDVLGSMRSGLSQVPDLTEQTLERFEAGESVEPLIAAMDQFLEEDLERRARGLRPSDLERVGR